MYVNVCGIRIHVEGEYNPERWDSPALIFLHGFTLSSQDWRPFFPEFIPQFQPLAIDLIGHGKSDAPQEQTHYTMEACIIQIQTILQKLRIRSAHWVGYSLGGRVLLHLASAAQAAIRSMVLESTTPGIQDENERSGRKTRDYQLARFIEENTIAQFVDRWTQHPIFDSQNQVSERKREYIKHIRLQTSTIGLANNLRGMGRGSMPPVWKALPSLSRPTLLLTGKLDEKHVAIHCRMHRELPDSDLYVVPGAGHNIHFERPQKFIDITQQFLRHHK